jgi:hypothetical protein
MSNEVKLVFAGDASRLNKTFDDVGGASSRMVAQVDRNSEAHTRLGERIGANEQRFMGTADLLDGLGGAFGLPTEGATNLMRSFADLSGGFEIVSGILPGLTSLFPRLSGAMSFISAHPLVIGILAGGAIIAGLIFLERRFGIVSETVEALGDAFMWAYNNGIRPAINLIIDGANLVIRAWTAPFRALSNIPGMGFLGRVGDIQIPKLDVGGTVLSTGLAVVHRGEVVQPAAGGLPGGGGGLTVNVYVGGHVTSDRQLVDAVHDGLLSKQRRTGNLGFRAA